MQILSRPPAFPRHVLMTADTVGGVWQYSLDLARGLTDQGIEVTMAAMGGRASEAQRASAHEIDGLTLFESDYKLEWMNEPWSDVAEAGAWLLDLAADAMPDLVHLNNFAHGSLAWDRPVLMVGHSCVYSWFEAVLGGSPPEEWRRYRVEVARGLAAADAVTAPSGAMLRALRRHYGRFRQVAPIHNAADGSDFRLGPKEPLVFGAGRLWDAAKNLAQLDAVATELPWPVYVAGSTEHPDGGNASFDSVETLGVLSRAEMKHWLGRASIYVLPARYEPFGLSALEAALSGCALVLGDIPSLREVWGPAATYVDPADTTALRAAIGMLVEDDAHRADLAARAAARARRYTIPSMLTAYLAAYGRLQATAPRRRKSAMRLPQPARRSEQIHAPAVAAPAPDSPGRTK